LSWAELAEVSGADDKATVAAKKAARAEKAMSRIRAMCDAGNWIACNVYDEMAGDP
jgi:hypothetical protein